MIKWANYMNSSYNETVSYKTSCYFSKKKNHPYRNTSLTISILKNFLKKYISYLILLFRNNFILKDQYLKFRATIKNVELNFLKIDYKYSVSRLKIIT